MKKLINKSTIILSVLMLTLFTFGGIKTEKALAESSSPGKCVVIAHGSSADFKENSLHDAVHSAVAQEVAAMSNMIYYGIQFVRDKNDIILELQNIITMDSADIVIIISGDYIGFEDVFNQLTIVGKTVMPIYDRTAEHSEEILEQYIDNPGILPVAFNSETMGIQISDFYYDRYAGQPEKSTLVVGNTAENITGYTYSGIFANFENTHYLNSRAYSFHSDIEQYFSQYHTDSTIIILDEDSYMIIKNALGAMGRTMEDIDFYILSEDPALLGCSNVFLYDFTYRIEELVKDFIRIYEGAPPPEPVIIRGEIFGLPTEGGAKWLI